MYIPEYFYKSRHILLVDDTPDNLRLLSRILESKGFKVRKTVSGKMAIQSAQMEPPDLILLDINMPEINGYEVCTQLKSQAQTAQIPIIFISALDQTIDKVKAFDIGGVDYITKPFQEAEVLARVNHQLVINRQQQQLKIQNQTLQQEIQKRQLAEVNLQEIQNTFEKRIVEITKQLERSQQLADKMQTITSKVYHRLANPDLWSMVVEELAMSLQLAGCYLTICEPAWTNGNLTYKYTNPQDDWLLDIMPELGNLPQSSEQLQFCYWEPNLTQAWTRHHSILALPIFGTNGIVGNLWLWRRKAEIFADEEIQLVQLLVDQSALASGD
ncbi:response regulator [Nostoc sp. TCL26-01]|uniref:response regulator n=1 Tax=Nostoc sp. TCL26-01 TaxID=2576904 RepID=UPI002117C30B|nr:response regulator [Nostoc sp. TCL26-01]